MLHKLEKLVFFSLIFSIPFQKRFFLFGTDPLVAGEGFFEWSSGFLYFTDFLVFLLAVFCLKDFLSRKSLNSKIDLRFGPPLFLLLFLGLAFLSLSQADLVNVGAYRFIKLAEFIFLFFYIAAYVGHRISHIRQILWAFVAGGAFQSVLAILQFAKQSSLGLEVFHESTLAIGLKGVAEISAGGVEFIRAYGTFPSPNILAGFLGICLVFAFCLYFRGSLGNIIPKPFATPARSLIQSSARSSPTAVGETMLARLRVFWNNITQTPLPHGIVVFLLSFALMVTFSRGVIIFFILAGILFFAGIFLFKKFKEYRKKAIYLLGLVIASWLFVIAALWPEVSTRFFESSVGEPAIQERLFFNEVGVDTLKQNYMQLLFGVGMGNFVHHYMQSLPDLPSHLYQPVHNIFILIASEIGILGLIAFVLFLTSLIGRAVKVFLKFPNYKDIQKNCDSLAMPDLYDINFVYVFGLLCVACFILLTSMYDHYFWTLQQGGLMFWMTLGLLAGATRK